VGCAAKIKDAELFTCMKPGIQKGKGESIGEQPTLCKQRKRKWEKMNLFFALLVMSIGCEGGVKKKKDDADANRSCITEDQCQHESTKGGGAFKALENGGKETERGKMICFGKGVEQKGSRRGSRRKRGR